MVPENNFIDMIALNLKKAIISSNRNRLGILYLLLKSPNYEMQTEKIASQLRISHRTALYHLDLLQDYGIVEVRKYRKKGSKLMRSVWGLNMSNWDEIEYIIDKINKKDATNNIFIEMKRKLEK